MAIPKILLKTANDNGFLQASNPNTIKIFVGKVWYCGLHHDRIRPLCVHLL